MKFMIEGSEIENPVISQFGERGQYDIANERDVSQRLNLNDPGECCLKYLLDIDTVLCLGRDARCDKWLASGSQRVISLKARAKEIGKTCDRDHVLFPTVDKVARRILGFEAPYEITQAE
jgi:hypothetical protein